MYSVLNIKDSTIRPLPFPYCGALSISNDCEFMSYDFFEKFMEFLNTSNETRFGKGVELEVTSSLFFYSEDPYSLSYFSSLNSNSKKNEYSSRIDEYLTSKWIDTIHSYGNFDGKGGFTREHAISCFKVLKKLNIKIEIFTNHGDNFNYQNIGKDATYHRGDIKDDVAYHVDLLKENGVQYVWTDSMITQKNNSRKPIFWNKKVNLLFQCILRDGNIFKGFNRFRSTGVVAPNISSLNYQLNQINWKKFYSDNGIIIIYQHLGVLTKSMGEIQISTIENILKRKKLFLLPFYFMKKENQEGRLWVPGLRRILRYVDMVESITIVRNEKNREYEIIHTPDIYTENPQDYFQGLTIYINPNNKITLRYKDKFLAFVKNGPDENGLYSISIPMKQLGDVWK